MKLIPLFLTAAAAWAQLPAFPGAEGFGAMAKGGRGGDVYRVTNLNDSGPGSLREGIRSANGPRTIVFDVSGTITLRSTLSVNKPFLTLAGQTAPGDGITVRGWTTSVSNTSHVIIRYMRFRAGDLQCPAYQGDALTVDKSTDVILDHVSASWSVDETLSVTTSNRVTVQWAMIAESMNTACHEKGDHGYGSLLRYGDGGITFHHTLFAHHRSRNPRIGDNLRVDFFNNVVYNASGDVGYSGEASEGTPRINYLNNYVIAGPTTPASRRTRAFSGGSANTQIWQSGNLIDGNVNRVRDGADTGWAMFQGTYTRAVDRFDGPAMPLDTAAVAYRRVLEGVGASRVRDSVDLRVLGDLAGDAGKVIGSQEDVGGWPELKSLPAPIDTDGDGMPDAWETAHKLNPRDAADGAAEGEGGYTNLENYLNGLATAPVPVVTAGSVVVGTELGEASSVRLFNGRAGTVRTADASSVTYDFTNAGGSDAVWGFFTAAGSPVRLGVGESLSLALGFSMDGLLPNAGGIRFGVLDSLGTRNAANLTGGMNDATFINDPGYGVEFYPVGSGSPFTLGRRAVLSGGNVFNNFGDFAAIAGTGATTRQQLRDGVPYTLRFHVERLTANQTRVTAEVEGGALDGLRFSGVENSPSPTTAFDYFAFRIAGPSFSRAVTFRSLQVEYKPAAPVITTQPQPSRLMVQAGGRVALAAAAEGSALVWSWLKDGRPITGNGSASTPTLQLADLRMEDAGVYSALVLNAGGSASTDPVVLVVSEGPVPPAPVITAQPAHRTVRVGEAASMSVEASGDGLFFQWFRNGSAIAGATGPTLRVASARLTDAGTYTVMVSNASGAVTSAAATLLVVSPMSLSGAWPAHGAVDICVDPQLRLDFDRPPRAGVSGRIRLFAADGTPLEDIDMSARPQSRRIGGTNYNFLPVLVQNNTAIIQPASALEAGRTYYVVIEPGVIADADGAPFEGLAEHAWRFSTRPAGPQPGASSVTVALDNTGDFCTVQGAIDFATQPLTINVRPGVYNEINYVRSNKPAITLRGADRERTIIQYPNNANLNPNLGRAMFGVDAPDFRLETITLHNTTPRGGSQAEAFRGNNQRIVLDRVTLKSFQDTLWLQGRGFVTDSYIEGDVDFLWGGGAVFIQNTELRAVTSGAVYTQIRNGEGQNGYVFLNCRLTAAPGLTGAWLSRIDPAVFPFSQVVFIDSRMGPHIQPAGWQLMNATAAPSVQFWEHNTRDLDGNPLNLSGRAPFSRQLSVEDAARWRDPAFVLGGWRP